MTENSQFILPGYCSDRFGFLLEFGAKTLAFAQQRWRRASEEGGLGLFKLL